MSETGWTPESETYSTEGPQCPHCGRQYTADDPWYYDEQNCTSETCDECGKPFSISVHTRTSWTCEPIETLSEAELIAAIDALNLRHPLTPKDTETE